MMRDWWEDIPDDELREYIAARAQRRITQNTVEIGGSVYRLMDGIKNFIHWNKVKLQTGYIYSKEDAPGFYSERHLGLINFCLNGQNNVIIQIGKLDYGYGTHYRVEDNEYRQTYRLPVFNSDGTCHAIYLHLNETQCKLISKYIRGCMQRFIDTISPDVAKVVTHVEIRKIPACRVNFSMLSNLTCVDLDKCGLETLPESLTQLKKLVHLYIRSIPITKIGSRRVLKNWPVLRELRIRDTKIEHLCIRGPVLYFTRITIENSPLASSTTNEFNNIVSSYSIDEMYRVVHCAAEALSIALLARGTNIAGQKIPRDIIKMISECVYDTGHRGEWKNAWKRTIYL